MVVLADSLSPGVTLAPLRQGRHDPTTHLAPGEFVRATLTPQGPGTVQLRWHTGSIEARAWGPGADFLLAGVDALVPRGGGRMIWPA